MMNWLLAVLTSTMFGHIPKCITSSEIWLTFEQMITCQSKAQIMHLSYQLQTTKKGTSSVSGNFLK